MYHKKPYSGMAVDNYADGSIKQTGEFKNGLMTGSWTEYYESGMKKQEATYLIVVEKKRWKDCRSNNRGQPLKPFNNIIEVKKSVLSDKWVYWFENGQKQYEREYWRGAKHGLWIEWNEKGEKVREQVFSYGNLIEDKL